MDVLSTQAHIEVEGKGKSPWIFALVSGTMTIGRDDNNHVALDDNKVSDQHLQITRDGMKFYVVDLKSTNGTYLGNSRLQPGIAEVWKPNQNLYIGDTVLRLIDPKAKTQMEVVVSPEELNVEPGRNVTATISLFNASPTEDRFSLSLTGVPDSWIAGLPSEVHLIRGEQREIEFTLKIPRQSQSRAGQHLITVRVTGQRDPSRVGEQKLTLTIAPYSQFKTGIRPQHLKTSWFGGWASGDLTIWNEGNLREIFSVKFKDTDEELIFDPPQFEIAVEESKPAKKQFKVKLHKKSPRNGRKKKHQFSAEVSLPKGETQILPADLLSRRISIWLILIIGILVCLLALFVPCIINGGC